jgi:DNA-binding LacI/PurR family transcriptional regulator
MPIDRPTLDTVAAAAGVSRMTVSNAYNRPDQLSAATRERILAVAAELGYAGPSPAGRSLRRGHAGTIGIVLTESLSYAFTDPGLVSFLRGVADELTEAGRAMLLVPTHSVRDDHLVRDAIVDAFVLCSLRDDDPAVAAVQARGVPVVTVGSPKLKGRPHIGIDNIAAAKLAADHLIGLGHRRLAVVGVPERMPLEPQGLIVVSRRGFRLRVSGFVSAAESAGLDPAAITVVTAWNNSTEAGAEAARTLLGSPRRPTAVFAVSDVLALGVLSAAANAGLSVPDELSVVGFDGIDAGAHSRPPLTTIAQDLRGQGRWAARTALDLLEGIKPRSSRNPPALLIRSSTGPPKRRRETGEPVRPGPSRTQ